MSYLSNVNFRAVNNRTNFRAEESSPQRQSEGYVKTNPKILNQPSEDELRLQMLRAQQRDQKNAERTRKIMTGVSIGSGLAIIAMALAAWKNNKQLTDAVIHWRQCSNSARKTAKLSDGTTHKEFKKQVEQLLDNNNLTDAARKHAGVNNKAEIYYCYGYGGTGKTYGTEQMAENLDAMYACVKYSDLGSIYKDGASIKVSNFFDKIVADAHKNPKKTYVVCLDEADALIEKVSESGLSNEPKKTRSAVITGIDRIIKDAPNVKLILTSNYHPDSGIVDDVVLRRISKKIKFDLPDTEQADSLLKMYLKKIEAIKPEFYETKEYKDFLNSVVTQGKELGYSGGELKSIADEAAEIFAGTLKGVADKDLASHQFKAEYLTQAKNMLGNPAAKTNTTMLTAEERANIMNATR